MDEGLRDAGEIARRRAGMKNRAAGILLHRVLEMWSGTPETLALLIDTLAREQGADAAVKTVVETRLLRIRESDVFQRILAAETIGRELPVYHDGEGRIDRLLATGDGYLVVDYKSGKPHASRLDADREQIERYCAAISSIAGAPCRGLLWYIDLESDAVIEVPGS